MRLEGFLSVNDLASLQRLRWLTYRAYLTTFVVIEKEALSPSSPDIRAWLCRNSL